MHGTFQKDTMAAIFSLVTKPEPRRKADTKPWEPDQNSHYGQEKMLYAVVFDFSMFGGPVVKPG